MPTAIAIIKDEHRSLAAVLQGLVWLSGEYRTGRLQPDFRLLAAMFLYIRAFPERLHHPKEDEFLYRILRERHAGAAPLLDVLEAEHVSGRRMITELDAALTSCQLDSAHDFGAFDELVKAYAEFHWAHMRKEEDVVMPMAEQFFTGEDWQEIDAVFRTNADPLADAGNKKEFRELFRKIVNLAPPPIGVGPAEPPAVA